MPDELPVERAWNQAAEKVLGALEVDSETGLDQGAVRERRQRYGANRLRRARRRSAWRILLDQLASLMVALLGAAAILAFVLVDWVEGVAIAAVIVINTAIGFFTELKATRSMEALYRMGQVTTRVRRGGAVREIPAEQLVPGDIVLVEGGDVVTADLRLIQTSKLQANESALTGESAPVGKSVEAVAADAPLAERASMLYKGTAVTRGSGEAVVTGTGLDTELGQITALVAETESAETPLERRLEQLGRRLIWVTLALAATVGAAGIAAGRDLVVMLETAIALAVATVPEGLPVVATVALARGMWRMAQQNALINRLSAVETLGATGVICTDKTGTLTENRMTVTRLALALGDVTIGGDADRPVFRRDGERVDPETDRALREALEIGVLCNNAEIAARDREGADKATGDPMEVALLFAGKRAGITRRELLEAEPEEREVAFDPENNMMATFHRDKDGLRVAVKGAPESVLSACTQVRAGEGTEPLDEERKKKWLERNTAIAEEGLRLLGLATKRAGSSTEDPYADLALVGLVGLVDPPRADVRGVIERCREAGIRVVMVTGDQAVTARYIADAVGLDGAQSEVLPGSAIEPPEKLGPKERERLVRTAIFARVSPRQKLDLIALHQANREIVAMTGDGVNDAPALKKADIGVAMGQRGTQVAREAADMVLRDDAFRTIVVAVEQGRAIFDNIRKFVLYLLSCNVSEVLIVGLATLASAPLPILPLQILFLNLVTDVFPALALGVGPGDPHIMSRRPRPAGEPILARQHWIAISAYGLLITAATLGAFWLALEWLALAPAAAVTVSFLTLALAQLWHVFNMRAPDTGVMRNDIVSNPYVWGALALCVGLLAAAVYLPPLATVLGVAVPDTQSWLLIITASLLPWAVGQFCLFARGQGQKRSNEAL